MNRFIWPFELDRNSDELISYKTKFINLVDELKDVVIDKKNLKHKFINEIHCNEIVLLAYYIAGINIESVYQEIIKENSYQPFSGSVLTDTFQLYEQDRDLIADLLPDNSNRRTNQKKRDIRVIIGNPPYSAGQKSFSDDAANVSYRNLDSKIYETYVCF